MKKLILIAIAGLCISTGYAQNSQSVASVKPLKSVKMLLDKNRRIMVYVVDVSAEVEGYDGDSLIIEDITHQFKKVIPAEANGLKRINLNSGQSAIKEIACNVLAGSSTYQITAPTECERLRIKIPNNLIHVDIDAENMRFGAYLSIKNLLGPFDVNAIVRTIKISNVSGLFGVKGQCEKLIISNIAWKQDSPGPYSYAFGSTGDIDITIPEDLKATITSFPGPVNSEIYSDLNVASLSNFNGALKGGGITNVNGGGVGIFLYNTNHNRGNTYIRKQK
ncbi:hypothetical protein GCM10027049_22800 [Mucilaginibacter puniceus]